MGRLGDIVQNGLRHTRQALFSGTAEQRADARMHIRNRLELELLARRQQEMSFERNGFVWTGPTTCTITRAIFIDGQHQDAVIPQLSRWVPLDRADRPYIVNVGANIGDTALPLTRICKHVIAIEPSPETFERLQTNVRKNHLQDRITCHQVAISTTTGTAQMVVAAQPGNSELLGEDGRVGFDGADQRAGIISVPTRPLDDLLQSTGVAPDQVAFVWSDTQGFESQVVMSGPDLWQAGVPLWVEVWPKGLDCHGGTGQFIQVCMQHFRQFVTAEDMSASRPNAQPISSLEAVVMQIREQDMNTDILLLP
jgi:FkbM family methyltransferase